MASALQLQCCRIQMLRVQRAEDGDVVTFTLSGRISAEHITGLQRNRRQALYSDLPPGSYRFGVILGALYQLRLHQVARQFSMGLEARVGERTRIARELHDTLLQNTGSRASSIRPLERSRRVGMPSRTCARPRLTRTIWPGPSALSVMSSPRKTPTRIPRSSV
jgi:hypothetical protein